MENSVKALVSLSNWILNKGIDNIQTSVKELEGEKLVSLKLSRNSVNLKLDPKAVWGSVDEMGMVIHYALMVCSGYLIKKENIGWVCFKLGNGDIETRRKYDLPSVEQCSCLRTAYNQGDCRHIKMLKGYLLLLERVEKEYKELY